MEKILVCNWIIREFRGVADEEPSVHYGYMVLDLKAGPKEWYNSGWTDLKYGTYASTVEAFIKHIFESVPDSQIIEF